MDDPVLKAIMNLRRNSPHHTANEMRKVVVEAMWPRLRDVLQVCEVRLLIDAEQFRFYERQHMGKTPPDESKAATNREHAELSQATADIAKQTLAIHSYKHSEPR